MRLQPGARLGPYEVLSALGAGGMGEVYRARDTTLGREVAIKILPEAFAADAERIARFQREAQMLAALNHPQIAAIYGLEDSAGARALVMELVEGPTLADRIADGPIPWAEALPIARQIAEALQAAHEQGIIHRDLKPANIKVREDGTVKVLDFGLAKLVTDEARRTGTGAMASQSPTLTTPAGTMAGSILGTAAYMAPEQAKGRPADKRCDVWAFGCVLYEMLTGARAFGGEDVSDTLAAVLRGEPDWSALAGDVPPAARALVKGCLLKGRSERIGDMSAVLFVITSPAILSLYGSGAVIPPAAVRPPLWRRLAAYTAVAGGAGALVGATVWFATRPNAPQVTRFTITASGPAALTIDGIGRDLALTPDGTRVVYAGNSGTQLFVRALDTLEPVVIATGVVGGPFVSPDGQWVGFVDNATMLKKVAITGGPAITITRLNSTARGATWAPDDTIIFATSFGRTGLWRVSAAGGTPEVLTRPDQARGEADHIWPETLPGGRAVLFTITPQAGGLDAAQVAVRDLSNGTQTILVRGGSHAHYVASGHLVYTAGGTLRAVPFDLSRLETRGTGVAVVPRLVTTAMGAGDFALATDGTLVYVDAPGSFATSARTLVWVDRMGHEEPIPAPPRNYFYPRLSPDGMRAALDIRDQENDIWIWDLRRATLTRLTIEPGLDQSPVWTLDGRRIIFASGRRGGLNLWSQAADGTGVAEQLTTSSHIQNPTGSTPDGTAVIFAENSGPALIRDLMQLALDGTKKVTPLLQTKFNEQNGGVSPDGRWLAYQSDSSGRFEIQVRPYPHDGAGQEQVSTGGGRQPLWARDGKELFYFGPDGALMRVPLEAGGATWKAGTPMKLLERRYYTGDINSGRTYDVSPDGQRFLMIKAGGGSDQTGAPPTIVVVQHWDEELKRLVPTVR